MKEKIAKLKATIAELNAKQRTALEAADAEGVSAEDRAKHLAEFDKLQAEKEQAQASLTRTEQLLRDEETAKVTPATEVIVQPPHNPLQATGARIEIPASVRRHGPLKAFKGEKATERAYLAGLWAAATLYGHEESRQKLAALGLDPQATLSTTSNSGAAYFVPTVMDTAILELTEEFGVIRRLADIQPMSSEKWTGPRWTTGMVAYWISQGQAPSQSEPGWDQIELVAKDLGAMAKMTRQLSEDAIIDLGDKVAMAAAIAFAYAEDNAAFNGDGTSQYGGITGLFKKIVGAANAASLYTATGHASLSALTIGDYSAVVGKFPNWPSASPRWLCHKEIWANSMQPLALAAGGATPADISSGTRPMFLGHPVEFVNVAPRAAAATTGTTPILFGDLSLSTKMGDRRKRTLERGFINDDFTKQLFTLLACSRVDINNHTITDPKNSANAGPVIGLKIG